MDGNGMNRAGLDWDGLVYTKLDWATEWDGLGWTGSDSAGLGWTGLNLAGL